MSNLQKAINLLVLCLKNDPDYYTSWHTNISMAFQDAYSRRTNTKNYSDTIRRNKLKEIADEAATEFLHVFLRDIDSSSSNGLDKANLIQKMEEDRKDG